MLNEQSLAACPDTDVTKERDRQLDALGVMRHMFSIPALAFGVSDRAELQRQRFASRFDGHRDPHPVESRGGPTQTHERGIRLVDLPLALTISQHDEDAPVRVPELDT